MTGSQTDELPKINEMNIAAFIVDLDGVVTDTAAEHAKAWKQLFDEYLQKVAEREGKPFVPFDLDTDYLTHVDGKPRYDGVNDFLKSRSIDLPFGDPGDPPDMETVCGLGNKKNLLFNEVVRNEGVEVFHSTEKILRHLREQGVKTAVVSSSKNCKLVLESVGLLDLFDVMVDGNYSAEHGLPGKPAPDTYVRACDLLEVTPEESAMVEDATVGVESGAKGNFKYIIGVDRGVGKEALREKGANVVVSDLGELDID
jgi:alpha,alpha-trehalase